MKRTFHYDDQEGKAYIKSEEDISSVLEKNKRSFNDAPMRHKSEVFNHTARIPYVVIEKIKNETGVDILKDPDALRKFLNDPDNKMFRTRPGKV